MKKLSKKIFKFFRLLFPFSLLLAVGTEAIYNFDIQENTPGYYIAILGYFYFSFCLAIIFARRILNEKIRIIKLIRYICLWVIMILVFNAHSSDSTGVLSTIDLVLVLISFFAIILLTYYFLYKVVSKIFRKFNAKYSKLIYSLLFLFILVSTVVDLFPNEEYEEESTLLPTPTPVTLIQPWQLNSRFKINKVVKYLKVDLDNDGKKDLAAITSYDKLPDDIFYYAGFYRFNPVTDKWDEFYGEELSILNYSTAREEIEPEKLADFNKKFIELWSTEFTSLENIGDITGDNCPEIVFSALLQGKDFENNIIVSQAGDSHFFYKIFWDRNTMAEIIVEDNLLIEKYYDEEYDYKDIYEWDGKNTRFKLIESQKKENVAPTNPEIGPELQSLTG